MAASGGQFSCSLETWAIRNAKNSEWQIIGMTVSSAAAITAAYTTHGAHATV